VATFRGGEVSRKELEELPTPSGSPSPTPEADAAPPPAGPSASPGIHDWRVEAVQSIAIRKILAPEGASVQIVKDAVQERRKAILGAVLAHELGWDSLKVTEDDVRRQYDTHPEQYRDPEKLRFQHIFSRAEASEMSPPEREEARKRLEGVRAQILGGADFDAMARQYSQSSDAQSGGWSALPRGADVFSSFTEIIWKLKVNEISPVIDTPNGFHVVKVRERLAALDRKYDDVKEFARKRAFDDKVAAAQATFVTDAGKRYGLEKHYERLDDPMIKDDAVLVSAGSRTLTMKELVDRLPQPLLEHLFNGFLPDVYRYLDKIALEEFTALEAEARGIAARPEVAERLRIAAEELAAQATLEEHIKANVAKVPEPELRDFYTQNQKRYETRRSWDLDIIMLRPEGTENAFQVLKRAEALVKRIRAGEDFAALARSYSKHYSARAGGRMEGLTDQDIAGRVQSTAKFRRLLQGLSDGEVGDPIVAECYDRARLTFVNTGAIIVRQAHLHPAEPRPFEKVKDLVLGNYQRRNHQRLEAEMKKFVLDAAAFRVYLDRLPSL
jgi:parvulin-like peptidyl-prolyl isomerase